MIKIKMLNRFLIALLCAVMMAVAGAADLKEIQQRGELRHLGIRYA